ncbi:MAG: type II toxin-antitoxin system HipA family toxin [Gammaproteobacteria bacterium]|nr:type II toxin-antitoxin system HipA family toxin [Gammaproteobacteria bacterium]
MTKRLSVWFFAHHVGELHARNGQLQFSYHPSWLAHKDAMALSASLPLQPEPFDDATARPFFAGLLPEGALRTLIARNLQISERNDFALLDALGGDCAGAIHFGDSENSPKPHNQDGVSWLSDTELAQTLATLPRRPMLAGKDGIRLSLAGAQDKLPVVVHRQRIGLPVGDTPSTHILKPAITYVDDSVHNEAFCMTLAKQIKLSAADVSVVRQGGSCFLLVKRYDRRTDAEGQTKRLHQEDFCQALAVPPEIKYQREGGPSLADCFHLLRQVSRPNAPQILRLLDYVIFNALIGNHDAHAKNFSLLYNNPTPTLAPLYDALSTAIYPSLTAKMAMKIGSKYDFDALHARHWMQFAASAGLGKAQVVKRVEQLATQLPPAARKLQGSPEHPFNDLKIVESICTTIELRCQQARRRLSL